MKEHKKQREEKREEEEEGLWEEGNKNIVVSTVVGDDHNFCRHNGERKIFYLKVTHMSNEYGMPGFHWILPIALVGYGRIVFCSV